MEIRKRKKHEQAPMNLLLADPSRKIVEEYLTRGACYVAETNGETIGVYVLLPTRPETIELINVAVGSRTTWQRNRKTISDGCDKKNKEKRLHNYGNRYWQLEHRTACFIPIVRI